MIGISFADDDREDDDREDNDDKYGSDDDDDDEKSYYFDLDDRDDDDRDDDEDKYESKSYDYINYDTYETEVLVDVENNFSESLLNITNEIKLLENSSFNYSNNNNDNNSNLINYNQKVINDELNQIISEIDNLTNINTNVSDNIENKTNINTVVNDFKNEDIQNNF